MTIRFSRNWNNKLDCNVFSTIRRAGKRRYEIGEYYRIEQSEKTFWARCESVTLIKLSEITEEIALLDSGLSLDDFKVVMKRMHSGITDDTYFYYIILRRRKGS